MADERIATLDAVETSLIGDTAVFEVEQPGLTAPESRKLRLDQLRALVASVPSGGKRVPTLYGTSVGNPYTHDCSAGVTLIDIEAWGGAGGSGHGTGQVGSGAGGGYIGVFGVTVGEGDALTINVGAGGAANEAGNGVDGGDSTVVGPGAVNLATATGGAGGKIDGVAAGGSGTTDVGDGAIVQDGESAIGYIPEGDTYPMRGGNGAGPGGGKGGSNVPHSGAGGLGSTVNPTQPGGGAAGGAAGGMAGADGWVIIWEYRP